MKRILSLILCLILCLSLIPLGAMAEDAENAGASYEAGQSPAPVDGDDGGDTEQSEDTVADTDESKTSPDETENEDAQGFSGLAGSGTPDDPYRIGTEQELFAVAELVNTGVSGYASACYIVTDDIALSAAFSPIGTTELPFGGRFDGCGHKIFSLGGDGSGSVFGLFGVTDGAVITRLALEYADISGSYERVGAMVGVMNGGSASECYVTGTLVNDAEGSYVGGLVGECEGAAIENCYNNASVSGYTVVGGVVGFAGEGSSVSCCYGSGWVESSRWNDMEGYVIGYADDSVSYSGIRAINGTDYRGYTLRDEHLSSPECFDGYDFENIWEVSWYGAPVLRNNTEAKPLMCLAAGTESVSNAAVGDYRALIIGEENYSGSQRRPGKITADIISDTLTNSDDPWSISVEYNLPMADMNSALASAFGGAASDSVNFFFYCGHGVSGSPANSYSGSISDTDENLMSPAQLASYMNRYYGHFIVILDSCGSGGVIAANSTDSSALSNDSNQAIIDAFDRVDKLNYLPNSGPMRTSKFSVITACNIDELSYSSIYSSGGNPVISSDDKELGYFCLGYWFSECAGLSTTFKSTAPVGIETRSSAILGDTNSDNVLTVAEAYTYLTDKYSSEYASLDNPPEVQVWPSNDTTAILSRVAKYTITYDANGGEDAPYVQTQDIGKPITLRSGEASRSFYRFIGWADSAAASVPQYQPGGEYTFSQDTTLYAVWDGPYTASGKCGDNLTWTLTPEGALTITGTGDMYNYQSWYSYRSQIKTAVINEGATSIGCSAFMDCSNLESVSIPAGVTTIGACAFTDCSNLESVSIPAGVTIIGACAFTDCSNLESVSIPAGVTNIGEEAFRNCDTPTSITVPASVICIGDSAFRDNDGLTSIVINEGTQQIGALAFYNSRNIQTLYIPHSVTAIGKNALAFICEDSDNSSAATASCCDVYYNGTAAEWALLAADAGCHATMHFSDGISGVCGDGLVFTLDSNGVLTIIGNGRMYNFTDDYAPWHSSKADIKSVVITEGVETVGNSAFVSCANLSSVSLPASLGEIGSAAFRYCSSLKSLSVPSAVSSIGSEAFAGSGLTEFEFPSGITSVKASTFANCTSLVKVTIPESVTAIAEYAFSGCTALTDVYYSNTRAKSCTITTGSGNEAFTKATLHCSKFTVSYNANGGSGAPAAQIKTKGTPLKLSAVTPTLSDSHFFGWSTSPSSSIAEYQSGDVYSSDADITLYAVWFKGYLLDISGLNLTDAQQIHADGCPCRIITLKGKEYAVIPTINTNILTVYTINDSSLADVHKQYPIGMKVYKLSFDTGLNEFTAVNIPELENLLTYSGTSIRYTGKKGIRSITSVNEALREKLINTYAGYTLEEYGTVMIWEYDMVDGSLTLEDDNIGASYAYKRGESDPIFKREKGVIQYTNVLLVPTLEKCKDDVAMRPYVILKDSGGQKVTIYGGIIYRSVGYVAYQNRNALTPGTDGYKFIWEIIHAVYGTAYDTEYKTK